MPAASEGSRTPVITFTMNGRTMTASDDETLLDAAQESGIEIPTLCHLPGLSETGSCRLCLVEIDGSSKLQPACVTKPREGMAVVTDSEQLQAHRRQMIELLLSAHVHVCSVCVANGRCELQGLAASVGLDHVRFATRDPLLPLDASHPRFVLDPNRCVLCLRCVRVCDEIEGAHNWGLVERGHEARLVAGSRERWGDSESCTDCGKCVRVCPTGALFEKGPRVER